MTIHPPESPLTGNSRGKFKDTLSTTYNAIARAVINYAAPNLSQKLSEINWRNLQTFQNGES